MTGTGIPCTVNEWGEWSTCSLSCNGTQTRIRTINLPQGSGVTIECQVPLNETRDCNLDGCRMLIYLPVE